MHPFIAFFKASIIPLLSENILLVKGILNSLFVNQGVNLSYGVPVNRTRLMAEVAVKNSKKEENFTAMLYSRVSNELLKY